MKCAVVLACLLAVAVAQVQQFTDCSKDPQKCATECISDPSKCASNWGGGVTVPSVPSGVPSIPSFPSIPGIGGGSPSGPSSEAPSTTS